MSCKGLFFNFFRFLKAKNECFKFKNKKKGYKKQNQKISHNPENETKLCFLQRLQTLLC